MRWESSGRPGSVWERHEISPHRAASIDIRSTGTARAASKSHGVRSRPEVTDKPCGNNVFGGMVRASREEHTSSRGLSRLKNLVSVRVHLEGSTDFTSFQGVSSTGVPRNFNRAV